MSILACFAASPWKVLMRPFTLSRQNSLHLEHLGTTLPVAPWFPLATPAQCFDQNTSLPPTKPRTPETPAVPAVKPLRRACSQRFGSVYPSSPRRARSAARTTLGRTSADPSGKSSSSATCFWEIPRQGWTASILLRACQNKTDKTTWSTCWAAYISIEDHVQPKYRNIVGIFATRVHQGIIGISHPGRGGGTLSAECRRGKGGIVFTAASPGRD